MGGRSLLTRAINARSVPEHSPAMCLCNMHHPSHRQQPTLLQTGNIKCNIHTKCNVNVISQDSLWAHTDTKQNCIYFVRLAFHHEQSCYGIRQVRVYGQIACLGSNQLVKCLNWWAMLWEEESLSSPGMEFIAVISHLEKALQAWKADCL